MQERSKLRTYLGFSIRAGKIAMGVNAIECTRKRVYALVMCSSAAKNTRKDAEKLRDRLQAPLCVADDLAELVNKENCKLCALLDRSLASAVVALFGREAIAPQRRTAEEYSGTLPTSEELPPVRKKPRKPGAEVRVRGDRGAETLPRRSRGKPPARTAGSSGKKGAERNTKQ